MHDVYCLKFILQCEPIAYWAAFWQAVGIITAFIFGLAGVLKIWAELARANEQRLKAAEDRLRDMKLRRTEFFLNQHRRLFDDKELSKVLSLLDDDDETLADPKMWDSNRKFITFIEEISLLVSEDQINPTVAYYMFGHYALCARNGKNFNLGIEPEEMHWRMFYLFCNDAETYLHEFQKDKRLRPHL